MTSRMLLGDAPVPVPCWGWSLVTLVWLSKGGKDPSLLHSSLFAGTWLSASPGVDLTKWHCFWFYSVLSVSWAVASVETFWMFECQSPTMPYNFYLYFFPPFFSFLSSPVPPVCFTTALAHFYYYFLFSFSLLPNRFQALFEPDVI